MFQVGARKEPEGGEVRQFQTSQTMSFVRGILCVNQIQRAKTDCCSQNATKISINSLTCIPKLIEIQYKRKN